MSVPPIEITPPENEPDSLFGLIERPGYTDIIYVPLSEHIRNRDLKLVISAADAAVNYFFSGHSDFALVMDQTDVSEDDLQSIGVGIANLAMKAVKYLRNSAYPVIVLSSDPNHLAGSEGDIQLDKASGLSEKIIKNLTGWPQPVVYRASLMDAVATVDRMDDSRQEV